MTVERAFVRFRNDEYSHEPPRVFSKRGTAAGEIPRVSIVIPTLDASRDGNLDRLLQQLSTQTLQDFEILLVVGDRRQGRAINLGADMALGDILVTFDDDSLLGDDRVLENLVQALDRDPKIGMAGGMNVIPADASWFLRRAMSELPRRQTPRLDEITDSDLAEHPCLAMRRSVFLDVGGENELLPRGLDPYLREQVREAGYRVVVVPGVPYHHVLPRRLWKLMKQFFRNGSQSAWVASRYPQWILDTADRHDEPVARPPVPIRIGRGILRLMASLLALRWIDTLCRISYASGWLWESLTSLFQTLTSKPATGGIN